MASPSICLSANTVYTKPKFRETRSRKFSYPTASLNRNQNENKNRRNFLKLLLGNGIALPAIATATQARADEQGVSSSRMSYSRFLEYLDKDRVKKVDLFDNGTIAIVEAISPELGNRVQRVRVQLPGLSPELLQKLREKNIDFAAHNAQEDSGSLFFNLIGNLAFPLILIGNLAFPLILIGNLAFPLILIGDLVLSGIFLRKCRSPS